MKSITSSQNIMPYYDTRHINYWEFLPSRYPKRLENRDFPYAVLNIEICDAAPPNI